MLKRLMMTVLMTLCVGMAECWSQATPASQMEALSRGLVVVPGKSTGVFVSWRLLGTEDSDAVTFDVLRDGTPVATDIADATSYADTRGNASHQYQVVKKVDGVAVDTSAVSMPWSQPFMQLHLSRPAAGSDCTYSPNDCSVGDVDGDGEHEIFVKWDPSNAKDNSQNGKTGNVYLDCYRVDWHAGGTEQNAELLWRVDLGVNIRAGAHYTQYMVYDFDGDGRAELMCKTAPGSKDGQGEYVNQAASLPVIRNASNTADHRNSNGRIVGGHEYLTVFEGLTGRAIHTIYYNPNRDAGLGGAATGTFNWDDRSGKKDYADYGNRGERYLAAVAHLDGPEGRAYGIFSRGYYTYAFIWAVGFDGKELKQKWFHSSKSKTQYNVTDSLGKTRTYTASKSKAGEGRNTMFGNGNHNLSVADVDGDGCDEIVWGSAALDHDGTLLYATGFGHGDAMHLADHCPDRPGLELFDIHEDKGTYSWDLHDAGTGEIIHKGGNKGVDNGRGIASQLSQDHRGSFFSSSDDRSQRSAVTGNMVSGGSTSMNFRIYWDGDLQDELLDGTKIDKWNGSGTTRLYIKGKNPYDYGNSSSCNGTKNTPNLQADLFGDWREEIILWNSVDAATLNVFTTAEPTTYRVPTLMHDHTYRMGIAWQNVAYNQPPHLGYYLPDRYAPSVSLVDGSPKEQTILLGQPMQPVTVEYNANTQALNVDSTYTPSSKRRGLLTTEFTRTNDYKQRLATFEGTPSELGDYTIVLKATTKQGDCVGPRYERFTIHVTDEADGIANPSECPAGDRDVYDLQGRRLPEVKKGVCIVRQDNREAKLVKN